MQAAQGPPLRQHKQLSSTATHTFTPLPMES